jgi:hypothetical protein
MSACSAFARTEIGAEVRLSVEIGTLEEYVAERPRKSVE